MWSRPGGRGRGGGSLQPDIDKARSASHHFSVSGSCQSSQPGPGTLVRIQAVTTCHRPALSYYSWEILIPCCPPHTEPSLICYLAVSVCLKYAVLFLQIHYLPINLQLNIKYENISNIAEYVEARMFYYMDWATQGEPGCVGFMKWLEWLECIDI